MTVYIQPGDPVDSNRYVPLKAMREQLPPADAEDPGLWTLIEDGSPDFNQFYDKVDKKLIPYPPKENVADVFCYSTLTWKSPTLTFSEADGIMRTMRSAKLRESDWIVTRSLEEGVPVPEPWRVYRQELRDVPDQPGAPFKINWPVAPPQ